jgi:GTP-binding protein
MLLSRRGLARTSNTPGCTRQINFFDVGLAPNKDAERGGPSREKQNEEVHPEHALPPRLVFVDLPGYGYAKVSKSEARDWKQLLEGYLNERTTLKAVVILVDVRRGLEQEEEDLIEFLEQRPGLAIFLAATKLDKIPLNAQKPAMAKVVKGRNLKIVPTSAETGVGREALWARILDACRVP